jgi:stearoyl-CoA desaturase (delta-9 desaturase)
MTTSTPTLEDDLVALDATLGGDTQSRKEQLALGAFIVVPFLAVLAAVPIAWGGWLGWTDLAIMAGMYWFTGHGVTVGFHRLFTHKAFKPNRPLKIVLAIAGSMAIQGPVVRWVADHRKHHKFSDRDGDPHSPWKYGTSLGALW